MAATMNRNHQSTSQFNYACLRFEQRKKELKSNEVLPRLDATVVSTRQLLSFFFGIREENSTKNIESTSFEWNLKQFEFSGSINPVDKLLYF